MAPAFLSMPGLRSSPNNLEEGVMADDRQKEVLEELVIIRWLLIFIAGVLGLFALVLGAALMK